MATSLFRCQCVWNVKVGTKWPLFCRRHFKCISISLKSTLLFLSIMWSSRAYWQYVIIDTGNDLAPNRRQAIAWTSDGLVLRCIYGSRFSSIYQGWGRVGSVPRYHINQKYLYEFGTLSRNASLWNACEDRALGKIYVCLTSKWVTATWWEIMITTLGLTLM